MNDSRFPSRVRNSRKPYSVQLEESRKRLSEHFNSFIVELSRYRETQLSIGEPGDEFGYLYLELTAPRIGDQSEIDVCIHEGVGFVRASFDGDQPETFEALDDQPRIQLLRNHA